MNCAICNKKYYPRKPSEWFCSHCYNLYKNEIYDKVEWVRYCIAWEQRERRYQQKAGKLIYLGDMWDISNEGNLVLRGSNNRGE